MAIQPMLALFIALSIHSAWSQQLQGPPINMPYNVSSSCLQALKTSVSCPGALAEIAVNGGIIDTDGLSHLCGSSCLSSLQSARSTIEKACDSSNDVVEYNGITYPATFFADSYTLAYNLACRKDSTTGEFCDAQIEAWQAQGYLNINQSCSDCWLGAHHLQLSHPLGFDAGLASNFAALTSACSATGYAFATPTVHGLKANEVTVPAATSAAATFPSSCTGSYAVQLSDTCISVSKELNVSTYSLLYENNLDLYCRNFNAVIGKNLCSPATCKTYTWQASDSCDSVAQAFPPMTVPQFLAWNPNFNSLCHNGANFIGYQVCVSHPGGPHPYPGYNGTSGAPSIKVATPTLASVHTNFTASAS